MNELNLLNFHISSFTQTLKRQGKKCSAIKANTVELLDKLLDTMKIFLNDHSFVPTDKSTDKETIFDQYAIYPKAMCRHCSVIIHLEESLLVKHLKTHSAEKSKKEEQSKSNTAKQKLEVKEKSERRENKEKTEISNSVAIDQQLKIERTKQADISVVISRGNNKHTANTTNTQPVNAFLKALSGPSEDFQNQKAEITVTIGVSQSMPSTTLPTNAATNNDKPCVISSKEHSVNKREPNCETKSTSPSKESSILAKPNQEDLRNIPIPKRTQRKRGRPENKICTEKGCIPVCDIDLSKKMQKFLQKTPAVYVSGKMKHCLGVEQLSAHTKIAESLEKMFYSNYPKVKAYPFGSRITGLATETSDLDIFLDLEGSYQAPNCSKLKQESYVKMAHRSLQDSNDWIHFDPIISARTPILRAWNIPEKIDCDISFRNGLSHCNSMLIKYLFELQPICYHMTIYLKEWAKYIDVKGLNSYTLIMLIVFFLQKYKLLPSVHQLQKNSKQPLYIQKWRADFERQTLEELGIPAALESSIDTMLRGFFSFYGGYFPIETHVVCPYLGVALRKTDFDPDKLEIPSQLETLVDYYDELGKNGYSSNDILAYFKPIVVQDPFDLTHNVAKGIDLQDASKFRQYCLISAFKSDRNNETE